MNQAPAPTLGGQVPRNDGRQRVLGTISWMSLGLLAKFMIRHVTKYDGLDQPALLPLFIQLLVAFQFLPTVVASVRSFIGSLDEPFSQFWLGYGFECLILYIWERFRTASLCMARRDCHPVEQWYFARISRFVDEYVSEPYKCAGFQLYWIIPFAILQLVMAAGPALEWWYQRRNSGQRGLSPQPQPGTSGGGQGPSSGSTSSGPGSSGTSIPPQNPSNGQTEPRNAPASPQKETPETPEGSKQGGQPESGPRRNPPRSSQLASASGDGTTGPTSVPGPVGVEFKVPPPVGAPVVPPLANQLTGKSPRKRPV